MWIDGVAQQVVDGFWIRSGGSVPFPRDLTRAIARSLPVAIVHLPRLSLGTIEAWLSDRGAAYQFRCADRRVRGCFIAHRGSGVIFVDGADPENEIRFTIAHELAHFLLDYWSVRNRLIKTLGPRAAEVLDGERPASVEERLAGALSGVPIGPFIRFMDRNDRTGEPAVDVQGIEDRADRVAVALLAPPDAVLAVAGPLAAKFQQRLREVTGVLDQTFGLPCEIAPRYAWSLLLASGHGPSITESLRS